MTDTLMVTDQEITDYFILNAHEFVNNGYTVTRCMDRYHAIEMVKHFQSRLSEPSMPEREALIAFLEFSELTKGIKIRLIIKAIYRFG